MGIYTKTINEISKINQEVPKEFTLENVLDIYYEWMEILESGDEDYNESLTEGANVDYTIAFKDAIKDYKAESKLAKKCIKSKEYSEAKSHVNKMKQALNKCEKTVKDTPSSAGSAIFGFFAGSAMDTVKLFVPSSAFKLSRQAFASSAKAGKVALIGISGTGVLISEFLLLVQSSIETYRALEQILKDIRSKNTSTADTLNYYRNNIMRSLNQMQKRCNDLNKIIDKKAKEDK